MKNRPKPVRIGGILQTVSMGMHQSYNFIPFFLELRRRWSKEIRKKSLSPTKLTTVLCHLHVWEVHTFFWFWDPKTSLLRGGSRVGLCEMPAEALPHCLVDKNPSEEVLISPTCPEGRNKRLNPLSPCLDKHTWLILEPSHNISRSVGAPDWGQVVNLGHTLLGSSCQLRKKVFLLKEVF